MLAHSGRDFVTSVDKEEDDTETGGEEAEKGEGEGKGSCFKLGDECAGDAAATALRSSTMGSKLLAGATVGFGFHIINRFLGSVSQVYQFPPVIAAIGPTCLFALLGLYLMRRVK